MSYQHFLGCLFTLFMVFFEAENFIFLWFPIYLFFCVSPVVLLVSYLINYHLKQSHEGLYLFPSSKSCIVLLIALIFRYLICFNNWANYYICCEIGVQFHSFAYEQSVVPAQFLRSLFFHLLDYIGTLIKNQLTEMWSFISVCSILFHWYVYPYVSTSPSWLYSSFVGKWEL